MPTHCEEYNGICVISVTGDLSADEPKALRDAAEQVMDVRHIVDLAIDLAGCDFIDSDGLEALLAIQRRCDEVFGQLKLVGLGETCRKIIEITRLDARFHCDTDLTSALKTMR